jgi:hypothetical protein
VFGDYIRPRGLIGVVALPNHASRFLESPEYTRFANSIIQFRKAMFAWSSFSDPATRSLQVGDLR